MSSGKKGKKTKGKTLALNDFLADSPGSAPAPRFVPRKTGNWADEVDNDEGEYFESSRAKEKVVLPTGPRSTWGAEIDDNKIPKSPPFLAYISNLPYEVDEEEISDFFKDLKIVHVRLPRDDRPSNMGKLKGFGYVEFENRQSLIAALSMPDMTIKNRRMRIDVADNSSDDRRRGGRDMMRGDMMSRDRPDGPDRTLGDWRSGPRDDGPDSDRDRGGGGGFGRDRDGGRSGGGRRDFGSGGFREGFGDRDRAGGSFRDGFGDRDRGGGFREGFGDRDRGGGFREGFGDRDRGGGFREGFGDRDRDRGGGGGFRDGFGGDRGRDAFGGDRDRDRGRFGDRDGFNRGGGFSDRRDGDRDKDYNRDSGFGQRRGFSDFGKDSGGRERDGGGFRSEREDGPPAEKGEPRGRPRLNLQPRTKPIEEIAAPPPAPPPSKTPASIFGGAKPVDTSAREREIEERLAREKGVPAPKEERSDDVRSKGGSIHGDDDSSQVPPRKVEPAPPPPENFWAQRNQPATISRDEYPEGNGRVSPHSEPSDQEYDRGHRYQERPNSPPRRSPDRSERQQGGSRRYQDPSPRRTSSDRDDSRQGGTRRYQDKSDLSPRRRSPDQGGRRFHDRLDVSPRRKPQDLDDRQENRGFPDRPDSSPRRISQDRDDRQQGSRRFQDSSPRRRSKDRDRDSRPPQRRTFDRDDRGRDNRGGRGPPGPRGPSGGMGGERTGPPPRGGGGDRPRGRESKPEREPRRDLVADDSTRLPKYHEEETPNFAGSNKFAFLHSDEEPGSD